MPDHEGLFKQNECTMNPKPIITYGYTCLLNKNYHQHFQRQFVCIKVESYPTHDF